MPVSIIVGGQFGSEGKGKVSYYFVNKFDASAVVRVGGTNSGHTVVDCNGKEYVFRTLPTACIDSNRLCVLPSGSYIDLDILFSEIAFSGISDRNLKIDPYSVIIDGLMKSEEQNSNLAESIGSTQSGTGAAVIERIRRKRKDIFAKDIPELQKYICDTKPLLRDLLDQGKHIVIEGTQGFGLSLINSTLYPHCTSRDTTAAGFLAETGLSPFDVENVIMVIRAYPIRVSGESGPLEKEIDWETVKQMSGANADLTEYTTVTKRIRRVAEFNPDIVKKAIEVNQPNIIVLNHIDYIDYSCHDSDELSNSIVDFIKRISRGINQHIDYIGTGKSILLPTWRE